MRELIDKDYDVVKKMTPRAEVIELFKKRGEDYKLRLIDDMPDEKQMGLYYHEEYVDMCRGPHVPNTRFLKAFKLTRISGAYWRGDAKNEQLQRIYGTAWADKKQLDAYIQRMEEAEKRDHRKLGKQLDLFHMQDEAPGLVFWHPKGWSIWQVVEQYMRGVYRKSGYQEVRCPAILDVSLWQKSGHWDNYKDNMFFTESEKRTYALKPMNCPGHIQVYNHGLHSYRDLPIRYGEFGSCTRNEPSGALHGLLRVRGFVQDDGHIFCTEDQMEAEVVAFHAQAMAVYTHFGFEDIDLKIALRPDSRIGSEEVWDKAENALRSALRGLRRRVGGTAGRGRVLRSQDRVPHEGLDRPRLAGRHHAGRFLDAGAPGRRIRRRGLPAPRPGHAAPGDRRLDGALHRHPHRAPCWCIPGLAGAGPGGRHEHHRRPGRLCERGRASPCGARVPGRGRFAKREDRL